MKGKIDVSQLKSPPNRAEIDVAELFASLGKDIVFIQPSSIPNQHTPDIIMDGVEWEIKSPIGNGRRTIENSVRTGVKQSKYLIFDLRHIMLSDKDSYAYLEREFSNRKYIKRVYIIRKNGELVLLSR